MNLKPRRHEEPEINVVLVSDIDCIFSAFFSIRASGRDPDAEFDLNFDNVPFVLNVLDVLAGDDRFVEIRTRRPAHRTLTNVSLATENARDEADDAREKFKKNFEKERAKKQAEFDERIANLEKRSGLNPQQAMIEILTARQAGQRELGQYKHPEAHDQQPFIGGEPPRLPVHRDGSGRRAILI